MINSSLKTTIDVKRQTRNFYSRANLLIRNFRYCTDNVKCYLFQSYCTSMYCCQLWFNSTKSSLKKLRTSYNSALRRFLAISKPYSASQMFVSRGILSFDELLRNSIYRFVQRIENSTNSIIHACLSSSVFLYSPISKWWSSLLYLKWHCTDMIVLVFYPFVFYMNSAYSFLSVCCFVFLFYSTFEILRQISKFYCNFRNFTTAFEIYYNF